MEREIASQPGLWSQLADTCDLSLLPAADARVAAIGCGTSYNIAGAYAARRESLGRGTTDAWVASDVAASRPYDALIAISRSGTTSEVIEAIKNTTVPTLAIVGVADTPIAELADRVIVLADADESSVVQTRFATTALSALRLSIGDDLGPAIEAASEVVEMSDDDLLGDLTEVDQVTYLGSGWAYPLAEEAALKLRESAQFWSEAYVSMEYRHGPISIAQPQRGVWALDQLPPGLDDQIIATGATLRRSMSDPMAELVGTHRLALAMARRRGLDPDSPRSLTRSVVLS
ncbi:MAG: sugar isomerase [Ilumatobacter coccineus]|uniref:Sugar isomerase n=1 Tax=Ilumatobacter coccineus TaxID=467094 RepID=A0A2G6K9R4_9ACTN|nr:MAG: sugar isomerase [Ilumatobacter coccineus]